MDTYTIWNDPQAILKSLIALYECQTVDERQSLHTVHQNGKGFNSVDAPFLSSVAERVLDRRKISKKILTVVTDLLRKYSGQINAFDLNSIYLPEILVYESSKQTDGYVTIVEDKLVFTPFVYPTKAVQSLGFKYSEGQWTAPLSLDRITRLKVLFPKTVVSEKLVDWIAQIGSFNEPNYYPEDFFDFQKEATNFVRNTDRCLLALSPGLGKSAVSIAAAEGLSKVLIVAPLSLVYNWKAEILKWSKNPGKVQIWHQWLGTSSEWVITNYDTITGQWMDWSKAMGKNGKPEWKCELIVDHDFDGLIIDESLLVKNRKAKRTKAITELANSFKRVWLLSGSPISRNYSDLWSQFKIIDSKRFTSFWGFSKEYCNVYQNDWGWQIDGNKPDAAERIKDSYADIYFSRAQSEVMDLPDWIIDRLDIQMMKKQFVMYNQMEHEFLVELSELEDDLLIAPNVLAQLTRLIQLASNPILVNGVNEGAKWQAATEMLMYEELPAIIWTTYIKTAQSLKEILTRAKYRVATLTGATKDRQSVVDDFQNGKLDVIVAHPEVGKYGFTMTAGRTAIYVERDYKLDSYLQSLYRIKRIGTTVSPHVILLRSVKPDGSRTVDHVIDGILEYRLESSEKITRGMLKRLFNEEV